MPLLGATLTSVAVAGGSMAKPMVSCSLMKFPGSTVFTKTGRQPSTALAAMLMVALTLVALFTTTLPGTTVMLGPNPTVVTPGSKCVNWPVMVTTRPLTGSGEWNGVMPVSTAGVLVTQKPVCTISE